MNLIKIYFIIIYLLILNQFNFANSVFSEKLKILNPIEEIDDQNILIDEKYFDYGIITNKKNIAKELNEYINKLYQNFEFYLIVESFTKKPLYSSAKIEKCTIKKTGINNQKKLSALIKQKIIDTFKCITKVEKVFKKAQRSFIFDYIMPCLHFSDVSMANLTGNGNLSEETICSVTSILPDLSSYDEKSISDEDINCLLLKSKKIRIDYYNSDLKERDIIIFDSLSRIKSSTSFTQSDDKKAIKISNSIDYYYKENNNNLSLMSQQLSTDVIREIYIKNDNIVAIIDKKESTSEILLHAIFDKKLNTFSDFYTQTFKKIDNQTNSTITTKHVFDSYGRLNHLIDFSKEKILIHIEYFYENFKDLTPRYCKKIT